MTATLPSFALVRPTTVADAVALLGEDAVAYCGGTELLLAMRIGLLRPATLVDLKRIPELQAIDVMGDGVRIGAAATHIAVSRSAAVRELLPVVADVERAVGNARVRAAGTVGGNVCFAEPKSDLLTTLVALDASMTLASPRGQRTIPAAEFLEGPYWTVREDDELLLHVDVPTDPQRDATYLKFQTMERPTLGVAAVVDRTSGACRVVVGAAVEVPHVTDAASIDDIDVDAIADQLDCVPDLTGSEEYKRHVAAVYMRRALAQLAEGLDDG